MPERDRELPHTAAREEATPPVVDLAAPVEQVSEISVGTPPPVGLRKNTVAEAREAALLELGVLGFTPTSVPDVWTGALLLSAQGELVPASLPAEVRLPAAFPDALPEIRIKHADLPRRIAHVEESGKICIAPTQGILLDAERPGELVRDAIARAARVIARGLSGESDEELQSEFLAYWKASGVQVVCICNPDGPQRSVVRMRIERGTFTDKPRSLLADSVAEAATWAKKLGATVAPDGVALFFPLRTSFEPPAFNGTLSFGAIRDIIENHGDPSASALLTAFLGNHALPLTLVLALPEVDALSGRRLVAVTIEAAQGSAKSAAQKGFRPGRVPAWRELRAIGNTPVLRPDLSRLDRSYLAPRGGASALLGQQVVAVVGIGSVGSEVAAALAAAGVGSLRLIDNEVMNPENVHRHALGVRHIGINKATALSVELSSRLPHQTVTWRAESVQGILANDADYLTSADLIVIALGDETLERRLNRLLADGPPRVHTWTEPLGIGGHALLVVPRRPGCFECLLSLDAERGLHNRAALTAPGQDIRRSLAGCAGSFSPFSALDSRRTALEASELVAWALTGSDTGSELATWRGRRTAFEQAGHLLSTRGTRIAPGGRIHVLGEEFSRSDCPVCGQSPLSPVVVPVPDGC
jgi:molybdopterin-synthase adenylyltransferase